MKNDEITAALASFLGDLKTYMREGVRNLPSEAETFRRRILAQDRALLDVAQVVASEVKRLEATTDNPPLALLVGGFVRDAILDLDPKDADLEVYGVEPEQLLTLLEQCFPDRVELVGKAYQIIKIHFDDGSQFDVSVPRGGTPENRASYYNGDAQLTPKDASHLSDFSVNSLLADPLSGEVFDYWNGIEDLREGRLRIINESMFRGEPNHVYRGIQFAARFLLLPDDQTREIMGNVTESGGLAEIHPRRITEELIKLLQKAERPSVGFELMRQLGIIEHCHPALAHLVHRDGGNSGVSADWVYLLASVDTAAKTIEDESILHSSRDKLVVQLATLLQSLGSIKDGGPLPSFDDTAQAHTRDFFANLAFPKHLETASLAILFHLDALNGADKVFVDQQSQAVETAPPARGKMLRGAVRYGHQKKKSAEEQYQETIESIVHSVYPASWQSYAVTAETSLRARALQSEAKKWNKTTKRFRDTAKKIKLDSPQRPTLVTREELVRTLKLSGGPQIGYIIGEVESQRANLITKTKALAYVRENLDQLLRDAESALEEPSQNNLENNS